MKGVLAKMGWKISMTSSGRLHQRSLHRHRRQWVLPWFDQFLLALLNCAGLRMQLSLAAWWRAHRRHTPDSCPWGHAPNPIKFRSLSFENNQDSWNHQYWPHHSTCEVFRILCSSAFAFCSALTQWILLWFEWHCSGQSLCLWNMS